MLLSVRPLITMHCDLPVGILRGRHVIAEAALQIEFHAAAFDGGFLHRRQGRGADRFAHSCWCTGRLGLRGWSRELAGNRVFICPGGRGRWYRFSGLGRVRYRLRDSVLLLIRASQ